MSRIELVEAEIREMSPEELADFRAWFERFDADAWDRQIEADAASGKLAQLAEQAIRQHGAGQNKKL